LEERHRIQIDCYHDDKIECDRVADQVEQAIVDHDDTLRSTYGIENVQKVDDADVSMPNELSRQCRVRMDFGFVMYRAVA
jgi:predicted hotdog family 3-hydroxylacyl-ACP dehydratase